MKIESADKIRRVGGRAKFIPPKKLFLPVAVYEYPVIFFQFFSTAVIWSFVICQNQKPIVKIHHYIINIKYLLYSEPK